MIGMQPQPRHMAAETRVYNVTRIERDQPHKDGDQVSREWRFVDENGAYVRVVATAADLSALVEHDTE